MPMNCAFLDEIDEAAVFADLMILLQLQAFVYLPVYFGHVFELTMGL